MTMPTDQTAPARAIGLDVSGVSKMFGSFVALKDVDLKVPAASFHAMLGENGAGKTTLVRCITGYYHPDHGQIAVDGRAVTIASPRDAHRFGIGMVHQSFTLVPSLTGAENLVIARAERPAVFHWESERKRMKEFLARMPFRAPLDVPVWTLSAGEKQKLQILKQLYLNQRFLILDEPTSVLTPDEAEELLGRLRDMTRAGELTVCLITHKFREVRAFADEVTVLRRGEVAGVGRTVDLTNADIARLMVGDTPLPSRWTSRRSAPPAAHPAFEIRGLAADRDDGTAAFRDIQLAIQPGEIVGIAGVSGNGQSALLEALCGQRALVSGEVLAHGERVLPTRAAFARHRMFSLPEEPLKNAAVGSMTVAENLALRTFDRPPLAKAVGSHRQRCDGKRMT
jgi:general nucleoside transport system ATP-binding protein